MTLVLMDAIPQQKQSKTNLPPLALHQVGIRWKGRWGLKNISLELAGGKLCLLLGANGAGKTTLLSVCCGLQSVESGVVYWRGELLHRVQEKACRDIGWLAHEHRFYLEFTVRENLSLLAGLFQLPQAALKVEKALHQVGLTAAAEEPAANLSRGMIQRLCLARLQLHQPSIWLLDEPFTGLDISASELLNQMLRSHLQQGGTVLMTSHQPAATLQLASRALVLHQGQICYDAVVPADSPAALKQLQANIVAAIEKMPHSLQV